MAFVSGGAYAREIDLSLYTETASPTTYGLAHIFNKGIIGSANLVTNISRLLEIFGEPIDPAVDAAAAQGWFSAREYLRNGNKLYLTRVESLATPAAYAAQSVQGGTDQTLATGTDGATSIPATRTLTSPGGDFVNDGVLIGDILEVHETGGVDNGFYTLTNVTATVLTVDRDWPTGSLAAQDFTVWTAKKEGTRVDETANGATSAVTSARQFTATGHNFDAQVAVGDILLINDAGDREDNGIYVIASVDSATQVTVDRDWPRGGLTALSFAIYGSIGPELADGSTATDGEFASAGAMFQSHQVQAGDILWIKDTVDTGNNGYYLITGLKVGSEETTVEVNEAAWGGGALTGLSYQILPGSITFQGESKGTWPKGYLLTPKRNMGVVDNFNLEVRNSTGTIILEIVYNLDRATVVDEMAANSALFTATVRANRTEPAIGKQVSVSGGDDGNSGVVASDFIGSAATKTGLKSFRNKEELQVDIVACSGQSAQVIQDELIDLAESRGDCIALVDPPDWSTIDSVQDILDFHNGTLVRTTALNTSYGALYWTWVKVYDEYHDVDVWTAPSGHVAGVYSYNDRTRQPWFAPAGTRRGKVKGGLELRYSPDQDDRDALQGPGANVNPLTNFVGVGIHVYGQKTLQRTSSATDRVNVRRMLCYAKRAIEVSIRDLVFEPNDEILWREFKQLVEPVLSHILTNRGIREYLVIADETTTTPEIAEQNKMVGKLFVKPTKAAEIIEVQFILTSQSANFQELLAAA
jgi:phage tail sheath protein FI